MIISAYVIQNTQSNGAACIENAQTVLEMLHLTMQSQHTSFDEIVQACVSEHIRKDRMHVKLFSLWANAWTSFVHPTDLYNLSSPAGAAV